MFFVQASIPQKFFQKDSISFPILQQHAKTQNESQLANAKVKDAGMDTKVLKFKIAFQNVKSGSRQSQNSLECI